MSEGVSLRRRRSSYPVINSFHFIRTGPSYLRYSFIKSYIRHCIKHGEEKLSFINFLQHLREHSRIHTLTHLPLILKIQSGVPIKSRTAQLRHTRTLRSTPLLFFDLTRMSVAEHQLTNSDHPTIQPCPPTLPVPLSCCPHPLQIACPTATVALLSTDLRVRLRLFPLIRVHNSPFPHDRHTAVSALVSPVTMPPIRLLPILQLLLLHLLTILPTFAHAADSRNNNNGFDHRAHAVPGGPYKGVDVGSGTAIVDLNGDRSHSHYFNPRNGVTGRILKYNWQIGSRTICKSMRCSVKFPRGITTIRLTVVDNTGDMASANVRVIVVSGSKPGLRIWYYPGNGDVKEPRLSGIPSFSRNAPQVKFFSKSSYPDKLKNSKFSIRMFGDVSVAKAGNYRFRMACQGGACSLWINHRALVRGGFSNVSSKHIWLKKGSHKIYMLYRRRFIKAKRPEVGLYWQKPKSDGFVLIPAGALTYKPSLYRPVINYIRPTKGRVGSIVRLRGSSFLNIRLRAHWQYQVQRPGCEE